MTIPFHLVNAFTLDSPHGGNQAAVVQLDPSSPRAQDDEWKALVARDFNFAETAYIEQRSLSEDGKEGEWGLRWWTPTTEVILCGHATLASALKLYAQHPSLERIQFHTRWSGVLYIKRVAAKGPGQGNPGTGLEIEMSLPSFPASCLAAIDTSRHALFDDVLPVLAKASPALAAEDVLRVFKFPWDGFQGVIVELKPDVELKELKVEPKALSPISPGFIILTHALPAGQQGRHTLRIDSRVFVPGCGVDEDPVTGSAHAYLTSYYTSDAIRPFLPAHVRDKEAASIEIEAHQLSERGGGMRCWVDGERVRMAGKGAIWGQGTLPA